MKRVTEQKEVVEREVSKLREEMREVQARTASKEEKVNEVEQ